SGSGGLHGRGRAAQVALHSEQCTAGVPDERAHVPLPQPRPVPPAVHPRCDRHEPPGRISEGPPEAVPSEGHTTSVATPAHGYLGNPGPRGQPETDATSAVELPQIPQTGPADARPAVGRSD